MCFQTWLSINHKTNIIAGVKDGGGTVGLTEFPLTPKKWMFSRPDMARVIIDFER